MSKINKIKLSGTTYDVEDANASKTVELTQAQYDALVQAGTVDPNTFYIITDAQAVDLSEYWTSGQTQSAIDSAVSGKADYSAATVSMLGTETISSSQTAQSIVIIFPYTDGVYYISGGSSNMFSITSDFWIGYNDVDDNTWKGLSINNTGDTSAYTFTLTNDYFYFQTKGINRVRNLRITLGESATVAFTYKRWADVEVAASTVIEETILPELSGKQDTLSAGTGIDITNNVISVTGGGGGGINSVAAEYDDTGTDGEFLINVNSGQSYSQIFKVGSGLTVTENGDDVILSATGGGSITIDPSLDTGSTNPVANSAITTSLNNKADKTQVFANYVFGETNSSPWIKFRNANHSDIGREIYYSKINGKVILSSNGTWAENNLHFSLVETSAVTSSMTSSSTDAEIPSAKCVYDTLGGLKLVKLTQTEYDNLGTKDSNTLYVITTS